MKDVSANIDQWHNLECRVKATGKIVWLTKVDGGHFWAKDKQGKESIYLAGYRGIYELEYANEPIKEVRFTRYCPTCKADTLHNQYGCLNDS